MPLCPFLVKQNTIMHIKKNIFRAIAAIALLSATITSCKKDDSSSTTTPTTVSGSASANVTTGSGTAAVASTFTATSAIFTNVSGVVDILAVSASGAKLTIHLTGVTAAGTFNFTTASGNNAIFINNGATYTTASGGGGNCTITTLSADKVEGTFNVESFSGTGTAAIYCNVGSGKFTAGK
jgi:hypothetical protein